MSRMHRRAGEDVSKPLREFGSAISPKDQWDEIVSLGMDRMCRVCSRNRDIIPAPEKISEADRDNVCKWCQKKAVAETNVVCSTCAAVRITCHRCTKVKGKQVEKSLKAFSFERLLVWRQNRVLAKQAVCLACDSTAASRKDKHVYNDTASLLRV